MPLTELTIGHTATISHTQLGSFGPGLQDRLAAMGILPGRTIQILRQANLGGPFHIRVGATTELAIRREEAALIVLEHPISHPE